MSNIKQQNHNLNFHHTNSSASNVALNHVASSSSSVSSTSLSFPKDEIIHAIQIGNLESLKTYISHENVNLFKDRSGNSILHIATNFEKFQIVKWLITLGADLNLQCNGNTVLSLALSKGQFELFDFYIKSNADCKGRNQLNLLHEAANKNRSDYVELLIERGADPNQLNSLHYTPLTIAVNHGNKTICQILLENGACATIPDKKGNTVLHLACSMGDADLIQVLIDNTECDFRIKNLNEETALDLLWITSIKESKASNCDIIDKVILNGGVFSMPWNFTFNSHNHSVFIRCMSVLCKYRLKELFLNDRPLFNELIINGYWRNSLIVSIKSVIIEHTKSATDLDAKNLFNSIENILSSGEIELNEDDLCSTFYMFDEVDEFEIYRFLKSYFSTPQSLRSLSRATVRNALNNLNHESVQQLKILTEPLKKFILFEK